MKVCPQCNTEYPDDHLFCLTDGNTLTGESGEQETQFRNKIVFPETTSALSPDMLAECRSCGLANRANSKFCKKCGTSLGSVEAPVKPPPIPDPPFGFPSMPENRQFPEPPKACDETRVVQTPFFAPPSGSGQQVSASGNKIQTNLLIGGALVGVVLIVGAVIYSSQADLKPSITTSAGSNGNRTPTPTRSTSTPSPAPANTSSSSLVGRRGRLTINQKIRSESHRNAEVLGVHYYGARIEVLESKSYTTDDGTDATWFRVKVLENGCDNVGHMGCGNDLNEMSGQAAMEGWMNARNIDLE